MEQRNNYQWSKTLRFGLNRKNDEKKNKSHEELSELVKDNQQTEFIKSLGLQAQEQIAIEFKIDEIIDYTEKVKKYADAWKNQLTALHQLILLKPFYQRLAHKANFNFDKKKESEIKAGAIKKDLKNIQEYWTKNLNLLKQKIEEFEIIAHNIANASDHQKIDLVSFRKTFFQMKGLLTETLTPLQQGSMKFKDKQNDSDTIQFDIHELYEQTKAIENYFKEQGGNNFYARVTLNYHTALQKPHDFFKDLDDKNDNDKKLKRFIEYLVSFIKARLDEPSINAYFEQQENKSANFKNVNLSALERIQYYKYKRVPVIVRYPLAEYLAKKDNLDKEKILKIFNEIGKPARIGEDFKNNQENFNLSIYPLKEAFDYAWEHFARSQYNMSVKFPKKACEDFLKNIFGVNENNTIFKQYAVLLDIQEKMIVLEYNTRQDEVKNLDFFKNKIIENLKSVEFENIKVNRSKWIVTNKDVDEERKKKKSELEKNKKTIIKWFENWTLDLQKKIHANKLNDQEKKGYEGYEKAKQKLGLYRGQLKQQIPVFDDLSKKNKNLSSDFGKHFAELRDKLTEETQVNKISHYGVVVEDSKKDRYFLIHKLSEDREEVKNPECWQKEDGDLKYYWVKSLTSKALGKIIKNVGKYKNFHNKILDRNSNDFLENLKNNLQESLMAKEQNWSEFKWDFDKCDTYEKIAQEIDQKSYLLKSASIKQEKVKELIKKGYILLPIINQDITSASKENKNQFSKDWQSIFEKNLRLHPEFTISYRHPVPNYPKPEEKRYSRFQLIGHLMAEYIPKEGNYISRKEQIKKFNDDEKQKEYVIEINDIVRKNLDNEYFILGIDRGIKSLATLCVLNQNGQIQGGFDIYTRHFKNKQWHFTKKETRNILDLTNLRVETDPGTKKQVLVDLSLVELKSGQKNQQEKKLKELFYLRQLQYKLQAEEDICKLEKIISNLKKENDEITKWWKENNFIPYKIGKQDEYADLPFDKIKAVFEKFLEITQRHIDEKGFLEDIRQDREFIQLCELDASEDLKRGVVANMVGVVAYLIKKYDYKVLIALEDLTKAWNYSQDALSGRPIPPKEEDFKEQENSRLAGLGTYQFFEMQLLKKLKNMQNGGEKILVPLFRSVENYEKIITRNLKNDKDRFVNYPFGIVKFIDPGHTSLRCANCEKQLNKNCRKNNIISCKYDNCNFKTEGKSDSIKLEKKSLNLEFIHNGDDNGAYHIAWKVWKNIKQKTTQKPQKT